MRPSLRFLALTIIGWGAMRAATLGALPGAEMFRINASEAKPPPIMATTFPPIEPIAPALPGSPAMDFAPAALPYSRSMPPVAIRPVMVPVYYAAAAPTGLSAVPVHYSLPTSSPRFDAPIPPLSQWPLSTLAVSAIPPRSSVVVPGQSIPAAFQQRTLDRLQLTAWALLRPQQAGAIAAPSLANGGTLGASQAGARLAYNFTRQIAGSFRTTTQVGTRGGEIAGGVRVQPLGGIPVWFTLERRQRLGNFYGRNAFALFFEGGVYDRPMPWQFSLDSYVQGGVVGLHSRDGFVDGALTLTRPVYKQFSAGMGVWGGAQPGVYRVDAGPRVTMRVRKNVRVHLDWRQRLAGNAAPGSGPAITLAGDF